MIPGGLKVCDAYVYSRKTPADAATAHVLTKDEARRIAGNIAKLPEAARLAECRCARRLA
ncbi:MAG: hypothetical protein ACXWJ4_07300 [Methyloceanibacter sp.]